MTNTDAAATTADRIEDLETAMRIRGLTDAELAELRGLRAGTAAQLREDLRATAAALVASGTVGALAIGHIADELTAAERAAAANGPRPYRVWYRTETSRGRTLRDIATVTAVDSLAAREAFEDEYPGAVVYGVDPA
jgi:hypothetical protein